MLGSIPYALWGSQTVHSQPWFSTFNLISRIYLVANLLTVVMLLYLSYRHEAVAGTRAKIRIVVLGGILSALLFITLNILPDALLRRSLIPYAFTFLFLAILPATYGYAVIRHRLIAVEKHVNRGATYVMVYTLLGSFYLLINALLDRWLPPGLANDLLINTIVVLALATVFGPLNRNTQKFIDRIFYGSWYDYPSAVKQITEGLERELDLDVLADTISKRLVNILRLQDTCVFIRGLEGEFSVIKVVQYEGDGSNKPQVLKPLPKKSLDYLLRKVAGPEAAALRQAISNVSFSQEELQLLTTNQDYQWVPIIGREQVHGYLALGLKLGGEEISAEDINIVSIVAQQAGAVIENIHLLLKLKQYAADLELRVNERTEELYNAKERVEAILASVGEGVVVTDLDNTIVTVNAAFEKQSGFSMDELLGKDFSSTLDPKNEPGVVKEMQRVLANGDIWSGELLSSRKNEGSYTVQFTIAPVSNHNGHVVGDRKSVV